MRYRQPVQRLKTRMIVVKFRSLMFTHKPCCGDLNYSTGVYTAFAGSLKAESYVQTV